MSYQDIKEINFNTLTKDEKVSLDIWTWHDDYLQPMQKLRKKSELERNYTSVFFPKNGKVVQLASENLERVSIDKKASGKYLLASNDKPYRVQTSWDAYWYKDVYLVNRENGERWLILPKRDARVILSPDQQFVLWYNMQDSSWNSFIIKERRSVNLTKDVKFAFYNELNDIPRAADDYGFAGWTEKGDAVVYDKYDLWLLDGSGKGAPKNLTHGFGRKHDISLRFVKLDKEERFLPKVLLLSAFNEKNKQAGYYHLALSKGYLKK